MACLILRSKLTLGLAISSIPAHAQLYNTVINTKYGPVQAFRYFNRNTLEDNWGVSESNVAAFLIISFAADTSHHNHWKPPQPREPSNGTLVADTLGPDVP
ncbi:hypothetical protein BJX99DRAFT_255302 [Aspergillus californicus]